MMGSRSVGNKNCVGGSRGREVVGGRKKEGIEKEMKSSARNLFKEVGEVEEGVGGGVVGSLEKAEKTPVREVR